MGMNDLAVKAGKKILKKSQEDESGEVALKDLLKQILKKLQTKNKIDDSISIDQIKSWIISSSKFHIDGKVVSLSSKKRKSKDSDSHDIDTLKKKKLNQSNLSSFAIDANDISIHQVDEWRQQHKIVLKHTTDDEEGVKASEAVSKMHEYLPYTNFSSNRIKLAVHEKLIKQCTEVNGFKVPSPIQAQCWPVLLHEGDDGKRRDVVGIAETGSGKTLAFTVPALTALSKQSVCGKKRTPRMLVLAPTRELAMQSHVVIEEFGSLLGLSCLVIYGGVPKFEQKDALKKGVDCIVATPGRIKDLINEGSCDLSKVSQLVLDEADRMLDMGFEEDVRFIISQTMDKMNGRQTLMFSATWPAAIQKIALEYMVDPVRVYVGFEAILGSNGENAVDDSLSANKRVSQTVEVIEDRAREARLFELLKKYAKKHTKSEPYRVLIFALYKKEAARLETTIARNGYSGLVNSIHGDKSQDARTKALADFKDGKTPLLVATDVAARGLDIPNVELVINYTFPLTIEDYVHRIGRSGRAGKTGMSYTFFQSGDKAHAGELQQVMRQAGQDVPQDLLNFGSTIKKKEHKLYGNFGPKGGPMKQATKITFDYDE